MLQKGAVEEAPLPLSPGYYARIFVVPKGDRGEEWRPIIDLSRLNRYVLLTPFKMETSRSVMQCVRKGDFLITLDLKDAYFQVPVHPHSSRYLRFVWGEKVLQFWPLCFGLSTAPQVFTRICAVVSAFLHRQGIRLLRYLDDWLLLAPSYQQCLEHRTVLLRLCLKLGLRVNPLKSSLTPNHVATYLGMRIDASAFLAFPKEKRISKFRRIALDFLRAPQSMKQWEVLLGLMASLIDLIQGCQLRMRPLQFALRHARRQGLRDRSLLPLPPVCRSAILWWLREGRFCRGIPLSPPCPTISMETDASKVGWGCRVGQTLSRGLWSLEECSLHINVLEIRAITRALQHNSNLLRGRVVALLGDNTTTLAYIKHGGGTRSVDCYMEARLALLLAESLQITLLPRFLLGSANIVADALSRPLQSPAMEWALHPRICSLLWEIWGQPQVDAFATYLNKRLPQYFSPIPDPQALGVDAFLQSWDKMYLYIFPPTKTLRKVLSKFRQSKEARAILIAPCWPQQPWFPDLLDLVVEEPRRLPLWRNLLTASLDQKECLHASIFNLHAWRLPSISSESETFRQRLEPCWPHATAPPPCGSTRPSGECSAIGAVNGVYIPSRPLYPNF